MIKLNRRQSLIFEFIRQNKGAQNKVIKSYLEKKLGEKVSRITIIRGLNILLKNNLIEKQGKGRSLKYIEAIKNKLLSYFDIEEYFKQGPDKRQVAFTSFNFDIFKNLADLFNEAEIKHLEKLNDAYQKRIKKMSNTALKKEIERLTIELSWKSSQIEGNTYSLIDTELLIKEKKEARGHSKDEAIMILNHKQAFDYIFAKKDNFRKISLPKIGSIHSLIVKDLGVATGFRKKLVGIVGTKYKPLDNQHQIREAMEKTIKIIKKFKHPLAKALVATLMIAYIQPFEDGNKRTSRLLGNAFLIAYNFCPLSFRSVDESDYKKAMILFYEQNSALFFKELFVEQFKFAVDNYFLV